MPWPDRRLLDMLGIEAPIVQAPMAGVSTTAMVSEVTGAGGLGSLPLGIASPDEAWAAIAAFDDAARARLNLNFFCHGPVAHDPIRTQAWQRHLAPHFEEMGLPTPAPFVAPADSSFAEWHCDLVEQVLPKVVSFHFGLPSRPLHDRVRATGAKVLCSATTLREARWLKEAGCDAIIAQGLEAGGHRGSFLDGDLGSQASTLALVEELYREVRVPVIAAGGIGDARGIARALTAGASAVQLGTAYLFCPEAQLSPTARAALDVAVAGGTVITNALSGRPARALRTRIVAELEPLSRDVPPFPLPSFMLRPLGQASDRMGRTDFLTIWCGEGAPLGAKQSAGAMTRRLAREARALLPNSAPRGRRGRR